MLRDELDRYFHVTEPEASPAAYLTHPSAGAWLDGLRTECAMIWYAQWYAERSDYWGDYRWQRLRGGHRARGDCEATIERLKTMASDAAAKAPAKPRPGWPTGVFPPGITVQGCA